MFNWFKNKINKITKNEDENTNLLQPEEKIENSSDDLNKYEESKNTEEKNDEIVKAEEIMVEEIREAHSEIEEDNNSTSMFQRFVEGLSKTKKSFSYKINSIFKGNELNDDFYDELEEILITGDIGTNSTYCIIERFKDEIVNRDVRDISNAKNVLKEVIEEIMQENINDNTLILEPSPAVLMLVGVNGVGKTTTAGKLAYQFKQEGKKVCVIAADTFRAAAIDQLKIWCDRAEVPIISQNEGSDPAAVVFDGLTYAQNNNVDVTIIDTAGRLHNNVNLMNELNKVKRIIDKKMPGATMEVILALDATTGQNALLQVDQFLKATNVTGIALNKLDGSAKGGVVISIQHDKKIPIKIIGVGEKIYDLQPFDPKLFIEQLFS